MSRRHVMTRREIGMILSDGEVLTASQITFRLNEKGLVRTASSTNQVTMLLRGARGINFIKIQGIEDAKKYGALNANGTPQYGRRLYKMESIKQYTDWVERRT